MLGAQYLEQAFSKLKSTDNLSDTDNIANWLQRRPIEPELLQMRPGICMFF